MRTETPVPIRLSDYRPYPFMIDKVSLAFDLDPDRTRVTARLEITPLGAGPMHLDGDGLTLLAIRMGTAGQPAKPLAPADYTLDETGLTLRVPPAGPFVLETDVQIVPAANTALSGLYMSGGRFCTQCEATGFRRITYYPDRPDVMSRFDVRIIAARAAYPLLLSNGTPGDAGDLPGGRHYATWDDPHKKPAYLFALCAGDYDSLHDTFTTRSGREVGLGIHVDKGEAARAAWAMDCLKRAMAWDEVAYGREYDLGVFNIVAVHDFNFGAMENKGLNIFNSAYVLADADTATDADFEAIESIVAHEYFHNWTGNRITCRDWFQLCLKEGLTVFRDQNFSAGMRSRPVQRIKDVIRLRARQFAEDAGPLAHPVRPDTYAAIDNLYTATVYEKGAEIIGMLRRLIGEDVYRKGMDLYFDRHDGEAVTIEDFYACFEAVSGQDFTAFRRWYAQSGTPEVTLTEDWDDRYSHLKLTFMQHLPQAPGEAPKQPVPIPVACAVLDGKGGNRPAPGWPTGQKLVVFEGETHSETIMFPIGTPRPVISVLRDFSAPVRLKRALGEAERIALGKAETDPFNQWDVLQGLARDEILRLAAGANGPNGVLVDAIADAVERAAGDPAFAALLTRLPDAGELMLERQPADPVALTAARRALQAALGARLDAFITQTLAAPAPVPFDPGAHQAGIRALRSAAITLRGAVGGSDASRQLQAIFEAAPDMTERLASLRALCSLPGPERTEALARFAAAWHGNALVMDKWFAVQASTGDAGGIARLMAHPAFDIRNPNRVRAVVSSFAVQNPGAFHAPDGSGYRAVEAAILTADAANPALGARLVTAFEQWRLLEPRAMAEAESALKRMQAAGLSPNAGDIVARALGSAGPEG